MTPPFAFGEAPLTVYSAIGVDGSSIGFTTFGAPGEAGDDSTSFGAAYIARRDGLAWSAESVEPHAQEFYGTPLAGVRPDDINRELTETLFAQAPTSSIPIDKRFYIRQPDGRLAEIGPTVPPAKIASWTPSDAEQGDQRPKIEYAGSSPDLSHVLFYSRAGHGHAGIGDWLWPGDTTLAFTSLYEYVGTGHGGGKGAPALVGVNTSGHLISQCGTTLGAPDTERSSRDVYNASSRDGRTVFFTADQGGCPATLGNEGVGEGPKVDELYARVGGSETVSISEPSQKDCGECDTTAANQAAATFQGASSTGAKVFFLSGQKLLSPAEGNALYEYDFGAPQGKRVLLIASNMLGVARVSHEGTLIYFVSEQAGLAANRDTAGNLAVAGQRNLYVYDTRSGRYQFIAALSGSDSGDWSVIDDRPVAATPDGRFLLFPSTNDPTVEGTEGGRQLYRYDEHTEQLVRISIGEQGFNNNGRSAAFSDIPGPTVEYGNTQRAVSLGVAITDDGSKVFFTSPTGLTGRALNNACALLVAGECAALANNVYEYENGHVYLITDGQDRHAASQGTAVSLLGATPSGNDVFFQTADRLVSADTNTQLDFYDARVEGGFPAAVSVAGCDGEGCQGPPATPPSFGAPASTTLVGAGNLAPPPITSGVPRHATKPKVSSCSRRHKRKHHRCVITRSKRANDRHTNHGRRGK